MHEQMNIKVGDEVEVMGEFIDFDKWFPTILRKPIKVTVAEILETGRGNILISVNQDGLHHKTFSPHQLKEAMIEANPAKFYKNLDSVTL